MLIASGRQFTWKDGRGVAEMSDLGWANVDPRFARIVDGVPATFLVASHRTETTLLFRLKQRIIDHEQEVVGWEYQSCPLMYPNIRPVSITIFND